MIDLLRSILNTLSEEERRFFLLINKFHVAACLVAFISGVYHSNLRLTFFALLFVAYDCCCAWASHPRLELYF